MSDDQNAPGIVSQATGYVWRNVSPSQIADWRDCHRKWWWAKPGRKPRQKDISTARGTAGHAMIEDYLTTAVVPGSGPFSRAAIDKVRVNIAEVWQRHVDGVPDQNAKAILQEMVPAALAGLGHLPDPVVPRDQVEAKMQITGSGLLVPMDGVIDLVQPDKRLTTDHKFTSDLKYAKTEQELETDAQSISYSVHLRSKLGGGKPIAFRHVVHRYRGRPKAIEVKVTLSDMMIDDGWAKVVDNVQAMGQDLHAPITEVQPNTNVCDKYRGCPYRAFCSETGLNVYGETGDLFADVFQPRPTPQPLPDLLSEVDFNTLSTSPKETATMATFAELMEKKKAAAAAARVGPVETDPAPASAVQAPATTSAPAEPKTRKIGLGDSWVLLNTSDGTPIEAGGTVEEVAKILAGDAAVTDKHLTGAIKLLPPEAGVAYENRTRQNPTGAAAPVPGHQINPPDGTPMNVVGTIETKKRADGTAKPTLPDGRVIADLKKPDLVAACQEAMAKIGKAGDEVEAAYLAHTSPVCASWYNRGPKVPPVDDLKDDLVLLTALLTGADLPASRAQAANTTPAPTTTASATTEQPPEALVETRTDGVVDPRVIDATTAAETAKAAAETAQAALTTAEEQLAAARTAGNDDEADEIEASLGALKLKAKRAVKAYDDAHEALASVIEKVKAEAAEKARQEAAARAAASATASTSQAPEVTPPPAAPATGTLVEAVGHLFGRPVLLIGAYPYTGHFVRMEDFVAPFLRQAAAQAEEPHYYLIKGYQEGAKRAAAAIERGVLAGKLALPSIMVCDRRGLSAEPFVEVLTRLYSPYVIERIG